MSVGRSRNGCRNRLREMQGESYSGNGVNEEECNVSSSNEDNW